jgi:hypothetical protein
MICVMPIFVVIFALGWTTVVLGLDGVMAYHVFKQFESRHYAAVAGEVTHSEVRSHRGSKGGTTYTAVINYRYRVDGRAYDNDRFRYNSVSGGSDRAHSLVAAHPAGSAVQVYYDPADPQESLLEPGLKGLDFMGALFTTPFNAVMLGFWVWVGGWLRERLFRPVAGGMKIIEDGTCTRVRLPQFSAVVLGLATVGGLGFVATFIVGFGTGMDPSVGSILSVVGLVYAAGAGVYWWQDRKICAGVDDLVIHQDSRTLELPLTQGRKERVTVRFADIAGLTVEQLVHHSQKGGVSYTYAPTLRLRGMSPEEQKLADWSDKLKADDFAAWLRQQPGLGLPPVEP